MQIDRDTQQGRCACTFSQRVLGDGCRYCQPQEYINRLHESLEEAQTEAAEPVELPAADFSLDGEKEGCYYASTVRRLLERTP